MGKDNWLILCERLRSFLYEQRKHGLAMIGNTCSLIINCGGAGSYSDGSVGMDSGDKM
jgi:hypothetical protein